MSGPRSWFGRGEPSKYAALESRCAALESRCAALESQCAALESGVANIDDALATQLEPRLSKVEAVTRRHASLHVHSAAETQTSILESSWRQLMPRILNAIASVAGFGHELSHAKRDLSSFESKSASVDRDIASLRHRIEILERRAEAPESGGPEPI